MAKKRKKPKTVAQKKIEGKIRYLKVKNKKVLTQIDFLDGLDARKKYEIEADYEKKYRLKKQKELGKIIPIKKRKLKSIRNAFINQIVKNNTSYKKSISVYEKRYKKSYSQKQDQPRAKKGIERSIEYFAWEGSQMIEWLGQEVSKEDGNYHFYITEIDSHTRTMESNDLMQATYDYNNYIFKIYTLK